MKIHCNCCGKEFQTQGDMLVENVVVVETDWGYFSKKDGERHQFRLCEDCYDKFTETFAIPVEKTRQTELL